MKDRIKHFLSMAADYWWIWLILTIFLARGIRAAEDGTQWIRIGKPAPPVSEAQILHITEETIEPTVLAATPAPTPPGPDSPVYISKSGEAYHTDPGCSRMKNPECVSREEAEKMGRRPCSRCVPGVD